MNQPTHDTMPEALAGARIDDAVMALRPDYRALLLVATDVVGGPSDAASDAVLAEAERAGHRRTPTDSKDAEIKAAVRKPSWQPTHALTTNHGGVPAFHVIVRSRMVGRSRYP